MRHGEARTNLNPAAMAYCTTPTIAALLKSRQRFTSSDSPLWKGAVHEGEIEGVRARSTKQMPSANLIMGDWSAIYLIEWGGLALRVKTYQDFNKGLVGIRAMWMIDVVVRYPLSFSVATGVN
jgi:HK97 family phage major capsid protein